MLFAFGSVLCSLFGHHAGDRQMDTDFRAYSRCRRCGTPLVERDKGKWSVDDQRE